MNVLLQALSIPTGFWSTLPALASEEQDISPLIAAYNWSILFSRCIFSLYCGISVLAQDQIKVVIRNRITCTNCLQSDDWEDIHMIVKLNVAGNFNDAFNNFLNEEVILKRECPGCLSRNNASLEKWVVVAGNYLIIHLKIYLLNDGGWVKDRVWWIVLWDSCLFLST